MWGGGWNSTCGSSGCIHTWITFLCWAARNKQTQKIIWGGGRGAGGGGRMQLAMWVLRGVYIHGLRFCVGLHHTHTRKKGEKRRRKKGDRNVYLNSCITGIFSGV